MRNSSVAGAGYVGLLTAACLAEFGREATLLEIDPRKQRGVVRSMLPISEPDSPELRQRNWVVGTRETGSASVKLDSDSPHFAEVMSW